MKRVLTKFLAISSIALLMLASCKKDGTKVVATNGKAGTLQASSTTIVLTKADIANTAVTFTWTASDFGYKAAVTNVLQIDVVGDNFATPKEFTIGSGLTQSFKVPDFNALVLALNLPTGIASPIEARIKSRISTNSAPVYSNVLPLTVTPFALISYVWVPGEYQNTDGASGKQWQPGTADSLVSPTGNGVYKGYVHFINANSPFKITPAKNWNTSYGSASAGTISLSAGGNINSPATPGLYLVTVDTNLGTIAYESQDHLWSVIGDGAIDWNTDVNMTFNQNANVYQVTTAMKASGQFKFRADNAWTLSLGNSSTAGVLTSNNGANLPVPSDGTYLVTLSYGDPLLGATYKIVKQ